MDARLDPPPNQTAVLAFAHLLANPLLVGRAWRNLIRGARWSPGSARHRPPDPEDWGVPRRLRYFIRSRAFRDQFGAVSPEQAYALIQRHATHGRRGPVFDASDVLTNANGANSNYFWKSFRGSRQPDL